MSISRRERTMILAALAVALLIGLPGFLFPGGRTSLKTPSASELAEQSMHRQELRRSLARARTELGALESQRDRLLARSSVRQVVQEMVGSTQRAARLAGLRIGDLKPLPPEKVSGLQRVPMELSISAEFPPTVRFLYELQQAGHGFRIEEARLSSTGPQQAKMDLELRLVGFVRSEEDANAAGS